MDHDHGQYSALCVSTFNAGGYLLMENTECDQNKMNNCLHDNNNPNVPGNGVSGLAGGGPVGTGVIPAGTTSITRAAVNTPRR